MDAKKLGIEHGDKAAVVVVVLLCVWSLLGSIGEVQKPLSPPDTLIANAGKVEKYLVSGQGKRYVLVDLEGKVALAYDPATNKVVLRTIPARTAYARPARLPVKIEGGGQQTTFKTVVARWHRPAGLAASPQLGVVDLNFEIDPTTEHAVAVKFVIERRKKGETAWKLLDTVAAEGPEQKAYSFQDRSVGSKENYEYRVQGVGTVNPPENTKDIHFTVEPPQERMADVGEEDIMIGEKKAKRPLWTSDFCVAVGVTTPSNIRIFHEGAVTAPDGTRKARAVVMRYNAEAGWEEFKCLASIGTEIIGKRRIKKTRADGSMWLVTETVKSDSRLLAISDRIKDETVKKWVTKQDPESGQIIRVQEDFIKKVRVQQLKCRDLTLKTEFWAPPYKEADLPTGGGGTKEPENGPIAGREKPKVDSDPGALISRRRPPAGRLTAEEIARAKRSIGDSKARTDKRRKEADAREAEDARRRARDTERRRDEEEMMRRQQPVDDHAPQ